MKCRIILTALFCLLFASAYTQTTVKITGKVTERDINEPLFDAVIRVKGTSMGTISDANGMYTIKVPNEKGIILECSHIGFNNIEIEVKKSTTIDFEMAYLEPTHPYFTSFQTRDLDIYGSTPTTHFGIGYTAVNVSPFWKTYRYNSFLKTYNFSTSYHTDFSDNMVIKSEIKELVKRGIFHSLHATFSRYDIPDSQVNMNTYMAGIYTKPFRSLEALDIFWRLQVTDFRFASQHADWAIHAGGKYNLFENILTAKAGFAYWFDNQPQYYGGIEVSLWNFHGDFTCGSWMGDLQMNASIRRRFNKLGLTVEYERFLDYENVLLKLSVKLSTTMIQTPL